MNVHGDLRQWSKHRRLLIGVAIFLMTIYFYLVHSTSSHTPDRSGHDRISSSPGDAAGNSTLGFETILTVSSKPSWRTRGLSAAAEVAKLDIVVPPQPFISGEMVKAYSGIGSEDTNAKRPSQGSSKAWLAHLDMIKHAVSSGFESALIIEDDADWDITIREQMRKLSYNIRAYTSTPETDMAPYGSSWDVLWIGHCGEVTAPETPKWEYLDSSLIPTELYAGWTKKWLVNIREGYRAIQWTKQTVCTFGYGISRIGAQNVLRTTGHGQNEAFDIALMTACQQNKLRCLSVNPELMHHYNPKDGTGYISTNDEANGKGHSSEDAAFEALEGTTANMKNSARCAALFNDICLQPPTRAEDY